MALFISACILASAFAAGPAIGPPSDKAPLAMQAPPLALWVEGPVRVHASDTPPTVTNPVPALGLGPLVPPPAGDTLLVGDRLTRPFTLLELGPTGRVVLLGDRTQLVTLRGPGSWLVERAADHSRIPGPLSARQVPLGAEHAPDPDDLPGGPDFPPLSLPGASPSLGATLALVAPDAAVTREVTPELRWSWPYADGHFDLEVVRIDPATGIVLEVIERWQNLAGRAHRLMVALDRGATYRLHLALRSGAAASTVIADTQLIRVLPQTDVDQLGLALATIADLDQALGSGGEHGYHPEVEVLRARLLESYGLLGEAQALWTGLALLRPDRPELFQHALRLRARARAELPPAPHPE